MTIEYFVILLIAFCVLLALAIIMWIIEALFERKYRKYDVPYIYVRRPEKYLEVMKLNKKKVNLFDKTK